MSSPNARTDLRAVDGCAIHHCAPHNYARADAFAINQRASHDYDAFRHDGSDPVR